MAHADLNLWDELRQGNQSSLNTIYTEHQQALFRYGMRMLNDTEAVSDCLHDLFVKLWVRRDRLSSTNNIRFYLISALRNEIINYSRQEKRFEGDNVSDAAYFDLEFSAESVMIKKEADLSNARIVADAMNKLTARQKEIIYLKYFEELEYEQIAEIMDITVKGAYKLSARALESLRIVLNVEKVVLITLLLRAKELLF